MSNPSQLGAISYEAESAFGEIMATTATLRLPICAPVDVSNLNQDKISAGRIRPYLNASPGWILGTFSGTFKTKSYLTGHGSTTSGATAETPYELWLKLIFGNGAVSAAAGTTFTGGTATVPLTTSSSTFVAGSIGWAGALNDARGGGQPFVVSSHSGTSLTVLTGLGAAPSNGDVCYSGYTFYQPETTFACTSQRMLLQTTNLQYLCHGCHPVGVSLTQLSPGEIPTIEVTWAFAWYEYKASTFPLTVSATNTDNPSKVASGTIWTNAVGTATNATRSTARGFTIDLQWGMETLKGFGSANAYADIVGCRRTPSTIMVSWTEDADSATTTPVIPGLGTGTTNRHVLYNANTTDGKRFAAYFPNVEASEVGRQMIDQNLNRITYRGQADVSSTTTTDLTLSAMRLAFG